MAKVRYNSQNARLTMSALRNGGDMGVLKRGCLLYTKTLSRSCSESVNEFLVLL